MGGTDLVHIPYRGVGPALTDLIGGQVKLMFDSMPSSLEHIRAGRLRALAVTTAARSEVLPDIPTVAETVPGYETSGWYGVGVRKGTPVQIIDKLNREINAGLENATMKTHLADIGATPHVATPAQYRAFVATETQKWAKAVKFSGAKVE
jgi:tripartite-type tricarboxylate transporter receptor subunit TctC